MWSSSASCTRQITLTAANTATGARRRNGTQAISAVENATSVSAPVSAEMSAGSANT